MKQTLKLITLLSLVGIIALSSCGGDESPSAELEITIDGQTYSLEDANLYLAYDGSATRKDGSSNYTYRDYIITDGTFNGSGDYWSGPGSSGLSNASYIINLQFVEPLGEAFTGGSYPQVTSFSSLQEGDHAYWFSFENSSDYYSTEETLGQSISASGNMEKNGTMTIKMNVTDIYDSNSSENVAVEMLFKGIVQ
jgi:hypothetical protein